MIRVRFKIAFIGSVLALFLLPAAGVGDAVAQTCDDPTDLVTRTGDIAGKIEVCNDDQELTITYTADDPWCLLRTDLDVALVVNQDDPASGIPQTFLGTPSWWQFEYHDRHVCGEPGVYEIALSAIDGGVAPGDQVAIAARALVKGEPEVPCLFGDICVAWGDGDKFRPSLPATYFTYTVQEEETTCDQPGSYCTVFMTDDQYTGALGGLDGADKKCQTSAEAASLPGTFKAWIADSTGSPATRFTQVTVEYRLVDGTTIVAENYTDLITNGTRSAITINEHKEQSCDPTIQVCTAWSATTDTGTYDDTASTCTNWTVGIYSSGGVRGWGPNSGTTNWKALGTDVCQYQTEWLLCFQQ